MKKLFKILFILAAIVLVLIVGALVTLRIMFPPAELKLMAQNYVKENFHREISLDSISFNLIGVTLNKFALSESASFEQGTFVSAEKAIVKLELKPLFKKKIEISTIGLENLNVNVTMEKNGKFNFDDLMALAGESSDQPVQKTDTPADAAAPLAGLSLVADKVYIKNATINYNDKQSDMKFTVKGFNFDIAGFNLSDVFDFSGSFMTDLKMPGLVLSPVNFAFKGKGNIASMVLKDAYLELSSFDASYKNLKASVSGKVSDFENISTVLNGVITGIDNKLAQEFVSDPLPAFALPKITLGINALTSLEKSATKLNEFKVSVGNSYIKTTADVDYAKDLKYTTNTSISVSLKEVADMAKETLSGFKLAGTVSGSIAANSGKKDLPDVKGAIDFKGIGATVLEKDLKDLTGKVTISSLDDIKTNTIKGVFDNSDFTTSFSYTKPADVMNVTFAFNMDKFTLDDIDFDSFFAKSPEQKEAEQKAKEQAAAQPVEKEEYTPLIPAGPRSPAMNIKADILVKRVENNIFNTDNLALNVDLKNFDNKLDKTTGGINFSVGSGEIHDIDKLMKSSVFLKVIFTSVKVVQSAITSLKLDAIGLGEGNKITYDSMVGAYVFKDGVVTINKTDINSDAATVKTTGDVNLITEKLNMKLQAHIGKIGASGFKPVTISVGGTIEKPSFKLDVASTVSNVLGVSKTNTKEENAAAVKNAVDDAKSAIKNIGSLFKK